MHDMASVTEEHHDRQPRRARRLHHHLQTGPVRRTDQRRRLDSTQALDGRHRLALRDGVAGLVEDPHRVRARDAQIDPDQTPHRHDGLPWFVSDEHRPRP